jgi:hypothetical protein
MTPEDAKGLQHLEALLFGTPRLLAVLKRFTQPAASARPVALKALLHRPDALVAFPETQAALKALEHPPTAAPGGAASGGEAPMPPLLPPPLSLREAMALMTRAAEAPQSLDVREALTRHGLRDRLTPHKVE